MEKFTARLIQHTGTPIFYILASLRPLSPPHTLTLLRDNFSLDYWRLEKCRVQPSHDSNTSCDSFWICIFIAICTQKKVYDFCRVILCSHGESQFLKSIVDFKMALVDCWVPGFFTTTSRNECQVQQLGPMTKKCNLVTHKRTHLRCMRRLLEAMRQRPRWTNDMPWLRRSKLRGFEATFKALKM